jgi:3-dehydroquinate synthase
MNIVNVKISEHEYDIYIGRDLPSEVVQLLNSLSQKQKVIIVTDNFFERTYAKSIQDLLINKEFSCYIHVMSGGKGSKSFSEVLRIYGELEINNFARDSVLIALGGGVVGDLAGFVASTWYRGMLFVHIPTTLMAMIDSSIGGKVAINYRETINAVGNYYHPIANFMDINLIDSLSDRDYISGLAEVIKCAFIADIDFINYLFKHKNAILKRNEECLVRLMQRTIEIKIDHVHNDVREGGKRLLLNYGHTLGHAIEMATQTESGEVFRHGEGVALGMVAVGHVAQLYLSTSNIVSQKMIEMLEVYQLPTNFSASKLGLKRDELIDLCARLTLKDKKRKDNQLRFVLVGELGSASIHTGIPNEYIVQAFQAVIKS